MSRNKKNLRYFSYLLRLWETEDEVQRVWRASLEFPATSERHGFASLADLFVYLEAETAPEKEPPDSSQSDPSTSYSGNSS
jgi:hypothetical protein